MTSVNVTTTKNTVTVNGETRVVTVKTAGPQGPGFSDGDKGDVTVSSNGTAIAINTGAVTSAKILDGTIVNADINASAAIAGTKVNPNFGSQNIITSGTVGGLDLSTYQADGGSYLRSDADDGFTGTLTGTSDATNPVIQITGGGPNFIRFDRGAGEVSDSIDLIYRTTPNTLAFERVSDSQIMFSVDADDQQAVFNGNVDCNSGLDVIGAISQSDTGGTSNSFGTNIQINTTFPSISLNDTDSENDFHIQNQNGLFAIKDTDRNVNVFTIEGRSGQTNYGEIGITGNLAVTGTVDNVDIATRDTLFGGLTSSSGVLTDGVTATTQSASDNSTKVATTAYTDTAISNLVNSAPSTLDTLNELAAALGDDANFSTTVTNSIATKLPLAGGTLTGDLEINTTAPLITFNESGTSKIYNLVLDGSALSIRKDSNAGSNIVQKWNSDGHVDFLTNVDFASGIDVTGNISVVNNNPTITLTDDNNNPDYQIGNINGVLRFQDTTNNATRFQVNTDGHIDFLSNCDFASGIDVTGNIQMAGTGLINIPDSTSSTNRIRLGSSSDLQIHHDGGNGVIDNLTGRFFIKSNEDIVFQNRNNNEVMAQFKDDGACELFFDGGTYSTPKLSTTATGVTVDGRIGVGTDSADFALHVYRNDGFTNNQVRIEQDGVGDAVLGFNISGQNTYSLGIDNSDDNKFKISRSFNVNTNTLLTIDGENERVGIGTASPTNQLHIYDGNNANDQAELKIESFRPTIRFQDRSTSQMSAEITGDNSLKFKVSAPVDDDTPLTTRMTINTDGTVNFAGAVDVTSNLAVDTDTLFVDSTNDKVGINNASPTTALDVTGAITSTVSSANATILKLVANMGGNNDRTLAFRSPETDSSSQPFIIKTANAIRFDIDSLKTLFIDDTGQVNLHHDGSSTAKLSTSATGVDVNGLLTTNDIRLEDDSPVLEFKDTNADADNQIIQFKSNTSNTFVIQGVNDAGGGGGNLFKITRSGNHLSTFEAQKSGVTWFTVDNVNKKLTTEDLDVTGNITLPDNKKIILGDGGESDSFISFDGAHLNIRETSVDGSLRLDGHNIFFRNPTQSDEKYLFCNGASTGRNVELYCQGTQRLETTSTGVDITGDVVATGDGTFYNTKIGEWANSSNLSGIFHKNQTGSEFMMISGDQSTFISASGSSSVFIRGGTNSQTNQIEVSPTSGINLTAANGVNVDGIIDFSSSSSFPHINAKASHNRNKIRLISGSTYEIGTENVTYGGLDGSAITFQTPNIDNSGFLFTDSAKSSAGGVMAITSVGEVTIAHSLRLGYGGGDTTTPGATHALDVSGSISSTSTISVATSNASSSNNIRKITTSTSQPSGGADGDIWIVVPS